MAVISSSRVPATTGCLRLWVKSFDAPEIRPLPGTEAEVVPVIPPMFWSPDSQFIAFYADGKIKRVARAGGAPDVLCDVPGVAVGGSWSRDGVILVGNANGPLLRCSADGKTAAAPVTVNRGDVRHLMPSFLPDGRHFVYLHVSRPDPSGNGLYLGDLERPPDQQPGDRLLATGFGGAYVPAPTALAICCSCETGRSLPSHSIPIGRRLQESR